MRTRQLFVSAFSFAAICLWSQRAFAAWENLPAMTPRVAIHERELEIDAGQTWTSRVEVPKFSDDERPVLTLRARVQTQSAGGGCNCVMQVLLDGAPLGGTPLRPRLLNKPLNFDPPRTQYHFHWFDPARQGWDIIFGRDYASNWAGTGRDFEFVFDLTGLVNSGEATSLSFRHLIPSLPAALKLNRAPLVLDCVTLGVMKMADVDRLRSEAQKGAAIREAPVEAKLPVDAKPGDRAYEIVWSGRKESPAAQIGFENLTGWKVQVLGDAKVSLAASAEHQLWRKQVAKLSYTGGGRNAVTVLRPPEPVVVREKFDAANLWLYGAFDRYKDRHPRFVALLEDAGGREFELDLGPLNSCYWNLLHGVLDAKSIARARFPMKFTALTMEHDNAPAERSVYLESLAFYQQNRKPFTRLDRSKRSVFPTSDDGMLPTPPKDVKVSARATDGGAEFVSDAQGGALCFRVRLAEGFLHGVTAQWKGGLAFRPLDGGGMSFDFSEGERPAVPNAAKVVSSELKGGKLSARWRMQQGTNAVEWTASYSLRGRSLIVDVTCAGGAAAGVVFGQVAGLPNPRGIEVPYLMMGRKPGPWIACAGGLFVSVLPDWYHSDFSSVNATVTPPTRDRIGLFKGTVYTPLTNGRRNDLRERVLVTVSPEFANTLPNARNPASPNRERLAPYAFFMGRAWTQNLYTTLKRHGIDHLIASDFAGVLCGDYAEGFADRWRPHPKFTISQVQDFRRAIKSLGFLFSFYIDATDYWPGNEWFDENKVSLTPEGDFRDAWFGNFAAKPNAMPLLVKLTGQKVRQHYPADCVYLDVHSNRDLTAMDYEAGVEGAGMARPQVVANGDCILEARKWYGSTVSEGICRWLYAGTCDMDYATLVASKPAPDLPPLVDFDLLKIHPFEHGMMMGYAPSAFFGQKIRTGLHTDGGRGAAPLDFYRYVSASLAYGHMLILGYGYVPPLSRFIHYYAMMQGVQREYLTDTVAGIHYHNGVEFVPTSRALEEDSQKLGRVRVGYSRGLVVHVNYNTDKPWMIEYGGRSYELPPFGWLAIKPGEILAYSALAGGKRVDFVKCPDYIYLNAGDARASEGPLEVEGAVWLKRGGNAWRLIPCGYLGFWRTFSPPNLPKNCTDSQLANIPADRGCKHIVLDTQALLSKPAAKIRITARNEIGEVASASAEPLTDGRLKLKTDASLVDYLLR